MSIFLCQCFPRRFFHPTASTHPRGRTNRTNWIVWPKSCPTKKKWHNWNWRNSVFSHQIGKKKSHNGMTTQKLVVKISTWPTWTCGLDQVLSGSDSSLNPVFIWMVPKTQTRPCFNRFKGMKLLRSFCTSAFPGRWTYDKVMVFSPRIIASSDVDFSNLWKVFNMPHLGRLKSQVQNM